ncbi:MAG: RecX family transcriptional regulator [Alphaproteobacteria bacterium]|nr:MAG: RecX family transcriptional regulator [Alphaproteobacteria bacterium]
MKSSERRKRKNDLPATRRRGAPRPMTFARLERACYHYLGRFASTEARLAEVLERRIRRARPAGERAAPLSEEESGWIAELIVRARRFGFVDDRAFAEARARNLLTAGHAPRRIVWKLREAGICEELAEETVAALAHVHGGERAGTLAAAIALARRRRIGPFRPAGTTLDHDRRRREIAIFARRGIDYGIARAVVEAEDETALEKLGEEIADLPVPDPDGEPPI